MIDLTEFMINSIMWLTTGFGIGYLWREAPDAGNTQTA